MLNKLQIILALTGAMASACGSNSSQDQIQLENKINHKPEIATTESKIISAEISPPNFPLTIIFSNTKDTK